MQSIDLRFAILVAVGLPSFVMADQGGDVQAEAERARKEYEENSRIDYATEMLDGVDSASVVLSPKYYLAIHAVVQYRARVQKHLLSAAERELLNFNIHVIGREGMSHQTWLSPRERDECYVVMLSARPRPGEKVYLHRPAEAGRTAKYAVRKADRSVVKLSLIHI